MIPFAVLNLFRFRCKKGSLRVNSVMILVVLLTHAELVSAKARGRSYWETGELKYFLFCVFVFRHDPDILVGYEIQQLSWGFLLQRAAFLDVNLCAQISRLPGMYHCVSLFR